MPELDAAAATGRATSPPATVDAEGGQHLNAPGSPAKLQPISPPPPSPPVPSSPPLRRPLATPQSPARIVTPSQSAEPIDINIHHHSSLALSDAPSSTRLASPMSYRDAILGAVEDLRDHISGSSVLSIKKHVLASLPPDVVIRDGIFLRRLRELCERGEIEKAAEGRYRLSSDFVRRRALAESQRAEEKARKEKEAKALALAARKASNLKDAPRHGRPERAKRKLNEGKVVSIVREGRKTQRMDLELEDSSKNGPVCNHPHPHSEPERKEGPRRKSVVAKKKIMTQKVLRKAVKDPMETI